MLIKKLYQNYNSVDLCEEGGRKVVKKEFKDKFCWENETKVIGILKRNGLPVPEMLKSEHLKNTYEFIDAPDFNQTLKESPEKADLLLELLNKFSGIRDPDLYCFKDRKDNLFNRSKRLLSDGKINLILYNKLVNITERYTPNFFQFVHGDFRPANIFGKEDVKGIIDFEFSGIDDPNKDLAYLWVGAVDINKELNHYLKNGFKEFDYFEDNSFIFWLSYVHVMILNNPRAEFPEKWRTNLEQILS